MHAHVYLCLCHAQDVGNHIVSIFQNYDTKYHNSRLLESLFNLICYHFVGEVVKIFCKLKSLILDTYVIQV